MRVPLRLRPQCGNPLSQRTTYVRDTLGRLLAYVNALGQRTTNVYDVEGQRIAHINPLGERSTTVYDSLHHVLATVNPLGRRTSFAYDSRGNQIRRENALGNITTTVYDAASRPIATIDRRSTTVYDQVGNIRRTVDPAGNISTTLYNSVLLPVASIDPFAQRTSFAYNAVNNRVRSENPLGNISTTLYDAANYPVASINPLGNRYTFVYDAAGNKTQQIDPLARRTTWSYDGVRNQTLRIDARGNRTTYVYDAANELLKRQYPDGSRTTFAYDDNGNRILKQNGDISVTMTYDALRRRQSVTSDMNGAKKTVAYAYDGGGNRSSMVDPDGGRFTYSYDAANRITHLQNPQSERTTFGYDTANRRTVKKLANGTRASFSYDVADNITRLANVKSDGTTISSFDYTYDAVGNRTSILEAAAARVTYSYDQIYQLTAEHRTGTHPYRNTFTYDSANNRTVKNESGERTTYSYDAANQLTTSIDLSGTTTYSFDADGNQQLVIEPSGNRTTTTWNYENRTTLIQLPSGVRNTMLYEPEGLRVRLDDSTGTKLFVWDDQNYLAELDDSNSTVVVYTNEPARYGKLLSQRRGLSTHWFHFDALGSTHELTDSSEIVTDTYLYDAWGNIISSSGTTGNAFCFVGQVGYYFDPDTGTFYIRARIYDVVTARWRSIDPLGVDSDDANLYRYVRNLPTLLVDASGKLVVCGGGSGFAGIWVAGSASVMSCVDTCGNPSRTVICGGGGGGGGATLGGGIAVGNGCLPKPGWGCQLTLQVATPIGLGGGVSVNPNDQIIGAVEVGPGMGAALTLEGCYVF